MEKKYYFILIYIIYGLSSCAGGWTSLTPVKEGQVIDMGKYEIAVPKGGGWSYKTNKSQGFVDFEKNDNGKKTLISVAKGWISDEFAKQSSSYISNAILTEEERIMRARGKARNYRIIDEENWRELVTLGGKKFHVWGYTIDDWNQDIQKHIVYTMYIYIPSDYKVEKNYYLFIVGEPRAIGFKLYDVDLTIINSVLESFKEKK